MYRLYKTVTIDKTGETVGTGWLPSLPDLRDYSEKTPEIQKMVSKMGIPSTAEAPATLASKVDLRPEGFEKIPIRNQGQLGSCTANAASGVVEYCELKAFGTFIDTSRLFVYKNTRNLMGEIGDTGAWLRTTMGALALCGIAPEKYWPYTDKNPDFDKDPSSFVYSVADNYEAIKYFRHDPPRDNLLSADALLSVKKYLAASVPSMFGFAGFPSSQAADVDGAFPFPCPNEAAIWGHAIVAVGYDDDLKIKNLQCNTTTTGALLIRNSWGSNWGDKGYGWLPYEYVLKGLATDFWSLLSMEWVETGQFDYQEG